MNLCIYAAFIMLCALSDIAYGGAKTYYVAYKVPEFVKSALVAKRNEITNNVEEFSSNVNWVRPPDMEGVIAYFMPTMQADTLTQVEAILDEFTKKTSPFSIKDKGLSCSFVNEIYRPVSCMGMSFGQYAYIKDPSLVIFSKQINDMFLLKGIGLKLPEAQSNVVKLFYTPALYKGSAIPTKASELFKGDFSTQAGTLTINELLLKSYDDATRKTDVYKTYALQGGAPVVTPPTGGGTEGTGEQTGGTETQGDTVPVEKKTGYALTFDVPQDLALAIAKLWNQSNAKLIISNQIDNVKLLESDEMQGIIVTFPAQYPIASVDNYVVANFAQEIIVPRQYIAIRYNINEGYPLGAQYAAVFDLFINPEVAELKPYVKIYASKNNDNKDLFTINRPTPGGLETSFTINKLDLKEYKNGRLAGTVKEYVLPKKVVAPPAKATDEQLRDDVIKLSTMLLELSAIVR